MRKGEHTKQRTPSCKVHMVVSHPNNSPPNSPNDRHVDQLGPLDLLGDVHGATPRTL